MMELLKAVWDLAQNPLILICVVLPTMLTTFKLIKN